MNTKNDSLSDSHILSLVLAGDDDAYAQIVQRYEAKLLRYGMFVLKDYDVASDAVQESFIKAYINLRSFNLSKQFSPWIYRILHNEAMNVIKRSKKTVAIGAAHETDDNFLVTFATDDMIDTSILNASVQKCLSQIDIKYKEVLILTYFDNLKYEEISDVLHIPTSTVGVRIRRGKALLKIACEKNGVKS